MYIGAIRAEFTIPGSRSLKAKRKPLRSLIDRLRNNFKCSVAEVDNNDKWQRASIGVAIVSGEEKFLQKQLDEIKRFLRTNSEMSLGSIEQRIFSKMDDTDFLCGNNDSPPEDILFMDL